MLWIILGVSVLNSLMLWATMHAISQARKHLTSFHSGVAMDMNLLLERTNR